MSFCVFAYIHIDKLLYKYTQTQTNMLTQTRIVRHTHTQLHTKRHIYKHTLTHTMTNSITYTYTRNYVLDYMMTKRVNKASVLLLINSPKFQT